MSILGKLFRRKNKSPNVYLGNVLIIASSAKELWEVVETLGSKYESNIDNPIILDNGDFGIVVKRK